MFGGRKRCGRDRCAVLFVGFVSLVWAAPSAFGQLSNGRIAYWNLDGNYNDEGPSALHLTPYGGIGFGAGVLGQGVDFPNDAAKYLERSVDDDAFDFGGGDFTIALWLRFNSAAGEQILIDKASTQGWTLSKDPANKIAFSVTGPNAPGSLVTPIVPVYAGDWHHLAVVRAGTTLRIYFDNVAVGNNAAFTGSIDDSPNPLRLGRLHDAPGIPFNGSMDEVAIWSRAVSTEELTELFAWRPNQIQSGLIGYWKLDGNYTDLSPGHRDLVPVGDVTFGDGILDKGAVFPNNSSQSVLRPGDDDVYDFAAGDFTIALWVKFAGLSGNQVFVEKWVGPSGPGWTFAKHPDNSILFNAQPAPGALVSTPQSLAPGTWYHFAIVRNDDSIEMYRNNELIASKYDSYSGSIGDNTRPLRLGLRDLDVFQLAGHLDELAIWSRALTSMELKTISSHEEFLRAEDGAEGLQGNGVVRQVERFIREVNRVGPEISIAFTTIAGIVLGAGLVWRAIKNFGNEDKPK